MQLRRPAALALIFLFALLFAACSGKADPTSPSLDFPSSTGLTGSNGDNSAGSTQFGGPVGEVDVPGSQILLASGQTVRVDGSTQWSSLGDVRDLASLATAVSQGQPSRIEGSGIAQADGTVVAASIKAEIDDSGNDDEGDGNDDGPGDSGNDDGNGDDGNDDGNDDLGPLTEFEGTVSSVNVAGSTLQLSNGNTVQVDAETRWDVLGDVMSLSALASQIAAGNTGRVEGDGQFDGAVIRAAVIKAEIDEADDLGGDSGDDDSEDDDSGNDDAGDDDSGDIGSIDDMELEIRPDEWRLEWADGGNSGGGDENLETRVEDGAVGSIDPSSLRLNGPGGSISPVSVRAEDDELRADFDKRAALGIAGAVQEDDRVTIELSGLLADGTPWRLRATIEIRD